MIERAHLKNSTASIVRLFLISVLVPTLFHSRLQNRANTSYGIRSNCAEQIFEIEIQS